MYSLDLISGLHIAPSLGTLTTTGANETLKVTEPSGINISLLQKGALSQRQTSAENWYPVGLFYTITTGITVTAAVVTLRKNGVSAATGGLATLPIASATTTVLFAAFTPWTFAAAPAAGDQWSVLVSTTSTAGVVNPVLLAYRLAGSVGLTEGIAM